MAARLGSPELLPGGIFNINEDVITALQNADELQSLEIRHLWAKCALWQQNFHDPDSRRAENFWWHVWGSDRKNLPPRTLAKLLNEIREGPTVVPLSKPAPQQGAENESKAITHDAAGDELISPLLSPKVPSLGSYGTSGPSSFSSSSSSTIVACHGPGTPDKGKRRIRARDTLSPSAERPSPRRSILKKMESTPGLLVHRHKTLQFSFSPVHLPENVIDDDGDQDYSDDNDESSLEPPPSLIAQEPEFVLDPSWCAGEAAKLKRQDLRALSPHAAKTSRANQLPSRPVPHRAAPSDPGPAVVQETTGLRHTSSANNVGPLVRVVGFGPFPKPAGSRALDSTICSDGSQPQPLGFQRGFGKEEPRPLLELGPGWGELPRPAPSPGLARSATLARLERAPGHFSGDNPPDAGSGASSSNIELPADLARPLIPDTYKRPKAVPLDTPVFGNRPFYLSSTIESRRATTIAHRDVERTIPRLLQHQAPTMEALRGRDGRGPQRCRGSTGDCCRAAAPATAAAGPSRADVKALDGSGTAAVQGREYGCLRAKKTLFIDDVLLGIKNPRARATAPKLPHAASASRTAETDEDATAKPETKAHATVTATKTTAMTTGRPRGESPSPLGEGAAVCARVIGSDGVAITRQATFNSRPGKPSSGNAAAGSVEAAPLRRPGSSSSRLSFLLSQERDRTGR